MSQQWHYRILGEEFGPVGERALRDLMSSGTVGPTDSVRRAGEEHWLLARDLDADPESNGSAGFPATSAAASSGSESSAPESGGAEDLIEASLDLESLLASAAPEAARKAHANEWYYRIGGKRSGPFDFDTLFEHAREGKFSRYDEIRAPGESDWVEASTIVGLFADEQAELDSMLSNAGPRPAEPPVPRRPKRKLWYYRVLNQEMGPVDFEGLFDLVIEGNLRPDDELRGAEESQWQPASSLVGLFPDELASGSQDAAADEDDGFDEDPDEVPEWYLRTGGKESGPVTFGRLVWMAGQGRLQRTDQIRLSKLGSWMDAESMVGLFPEETPAEPEPEEVPEQVEPEAPKPAVSRLPDVPEGDADDWAAAVLSEPEPERPRRREPESQPVAAAGPGPAREPYRPAAVMSAPATPTRPAFTPPPKIRKSSSGGGGLSLPSGLGGVVTNPKVLIAVGVLLVAVGLYFVPWGSFFQAPYEDLLTELDQIWGKTKALHESGGSDDEWNALTRELAPQLKAVADEANKRGANADNPGLQIALVLATKQIPEVLKNRSDATDRQVRIVDSYLTRAKGL
jgi:GYF domain 2